MENQASFRGGSRLPRHGERTSVAGCFRSVHFQNAEGFVIGTFEEEGTYRSFSAKGTVIPLRLGQPLLLHGSWENSNKYGMQFKVETYEPRKPTTVRAIEAYLGSGVVPGLGEKTARAIVARFGEESLRVMEEDPERLLEVAGVGPKLLASVREHFGGANAEQEAMTYLMGLGLTATLAAKAWKRMGDDTVARVQSNPYRLLAVRGIGFPAADAIALSLGWEPSHPRRIREALLYFLDRGCQTGGHAFLEREQLAGVCERELGVTAAAVEAGLEELAGLSRVVLDGTAVYPRFLHDVEVGIAAAAGSDTGVKRDREAFDRELAELQEKLGIVLNGEQLAAVWEACTAPLAVLTGGPGTGKTTTLKAILGMCRRYGERVVLASPTGRAAKRMAEVTGEPAYTVHRVLGLRPSDDEDLEDGPGLEASPLGAWDSATTVILDEASMLDMVLTSYVIENLGRRRLVLVGDADQLPSVGPGRILGDFIDAGIASVTVLTEVFRQAQDSGIVMNALRINRGDMPELGRYDDFQFVAADSRGAGPRVANGVFRALERRGFDLLRDVQVISPMKKGDAGVHALNALLQERLNPRRSEWEPEHTMGSGVTYRQGDKVMQIRNDAERDIVNGDLGYVLTVEPYAKRLIVDFGDGDVPRPVSYEFGELNENLTHAFASSVHKVQGSEYPAVVVVLTDAHYPMLQRNLLYTAVTRARDLVCIVGEESAMAQAVRNDRPVLRNTRLAERIRAAAGK